MYVCAYLVPEEAREGIGSPLTEVIDGISSHVSTGNPTLDLSKLPSPELGVLNL